MEKEKLPQDRVDRRFHGNVRHYHRQGTETSWDDWTGVKPKSPRRQQIERILLRSTILLVGVGLICTILITLYLVMKLILSASPN
jgi:hypothetical protein